MMTFCEAEKNYLVYLHAVHISRKQYIKYQRALQDILAFYGSDLPLVRFDDFTGAGVRQRERSL